MSEIPRCKNCNSELITTHFGDNAYYVCDNVFCKQLYRERQGIICNNPAAIKKSTPRRPKRKTKTHPGYKRYLARRFENYRRLRNLGVPANLASQYRDFSSCALLEAKIEDEGGVTEEVISWAKDRRKDTRAEKRARAKLREGAKVYG